MPEAPYQLSISRYIAASPETVWQVMTQRLQEWWCPKPWRVQIDAIEWRPGGAFNTTMLGPDGERFSGKGVLLEVTPGERFVFTDALDSQWNPQQAFMVGCFEIQSEGEGTRYTASSRHWCREDMEKHQSMGFTEGWTAVAEQLAAMAESTT
ncbi:activator of HSP90 ATPase [Marinobacterium zhoushanense]|uniref:Activator of HSP90 ATPase n=1 Tax=Marinobacterium zhoushanense TaxID=1679163 RepID=A0ABQ1KML8_9GAMM|nr:SRPBCC domain-containing protein [Marinobacterium zhoushanense]GGC00573.1 activator of HSP90 ATPase [Marinobacterium zhoushanense]